MDRRVALKLGALSEREATTPHQHNGDAAATAGTPAASLAGEASTGRLMVGTLSNGRLTAGSSHDKGGKTGKSDPGATPGPPIGTEVGLALGVSAQKEVMIPNRVATGSMPGGGSNEHREGEASVGAGNLGGLAAGTNIQELLDATSGGIRAHGGHQEPNCAITKEAGANPLNRDSDPLGHQVGGSVRSAPGTANDMGRKSIDEALQASQALKARRRQVRCANKRKRVALQEQQDDGISYWTRHQATSDIKPTERQYPTEMRGQMCPAGNALTHPAAKLLVDYATQGCPSRTGANWTLDQLDAAVKRGPHQSALAPEARDQHLSEVMEKVARGQARIVEWVDLRRKLPTNLKISPIAMVPHSSRKWRAILDLSFMLTFDMGAVPSVNSTSEEVAPGAALDQLGHVLPRLIAEMAETDQHTPLFLAKWDIKDGFWRLMTERGSEFNFAYLLPQEEDRPPRIVIPTPLPMGWTESPPFLCAAAETARDVAQTYAQTEVGTLPAHKFDSFTKTAREYQALPDTATSNEALLYLIEVFVDDFIGMCVPRSKLELDHVSRAIQHGIHDVFPPDTNDDEDPTSLK